MNAKYSAFRFATAIFVPFLLDGPCAAQSQAKASDMAPSVRAIFDQVRKEKLAVQDRYQAYLKAYKLAVQIHDAEGQIVAATSMALADSRMEKQVESNGWQLTVRTLAHQIGHRRLEAYALQQIGEYQDRWFEPKQAEKSYRESAAIFAELGDLKYQAQSLYLLTFALSYQGRISAARDTARHALELAKDSNDRLLECRLLRRMGAYAMDVAQFEDSQRYFVQSIEKSKQLGDKVEQAWCALEVAYLKSVEGRQSEAEGQLKSCGTLLNKIVHSGMRSGIMYENGLVLCRQSKFAEAIPSLEGALNLDLSERLYRSLSHDSALLGKAEWRSGHKFEGASVEGLGFLGRVETGDAESASESLREFAAMNDSVGDTERAIPELKYAINESIRHPSEDDTLSRIEIRRFPALDLDGFQLLSAWLQKAGRRAEAAEVRAAGKAWWAGGKAHEISFTTGEKLWKTRFESLTSRYRPISVETDQILRIPPQYLSGSQIADGVRLEQQSEEMARTILTIVLNPKIGHLPTKPKNVRGS